MMRRGPRLTPLGIGFCIAALVVLLAAATAEVPALLFVTSLLAGLVVAAVVFVVTVPVRVEVTRRIDPELLAARATGEVTIDVRLTGRAGLWGAAWVDRLPAGLTAEATGCVPRLTFARPAGAMTYRLAARRRGRHQVGPLELVVSDPFDLARRVVVVGDPTDVVVLPQQVDLESGPATARPTDGDRRSVLHRPGQGEDDVIARPYVEGDAKKRLHWKATARRGSLMVRQEENPDDTRALVLLDVAGPRHGIDPDDSTSATSDTLEWAVVAAASIVAELRRSGGIVELRTSDGSVQRRIGADQSPLGEALLDLAVVQAGPAGVAEVADAPVGTIVVLGSLDVDAAHRWARAVHRPAAALVAATTSRLALDVLDAAGWTWATYRSGDRWGEVWAELRSEGDDGRR